MTVRHDRCRRRHADTLNHSATHLLHAALTRRPWVSMCSRRVRWSHPIGCVSTFPILEPMTDDELRRGARSIEQIQAIRVDVSLMSYDEAIDQGAMALFGEKYGRSACSDDGRWLIRWNCAAAPMLPTGDIGCFSIISETGIAAGRARSKQ